MTEFVKVLKAIKIDPDLLFGWEADEALKAVKTMLLHKITFVWDSCDRPPYKSQKCLIAYSDGDVVSGQYVHNSDFDHGGFFTSLKEFDLDSTGTPTHWMTMPAAPEVSSKVA